MLAVAGAGMAGLCAAARARELGQRTVVFEKGERAGGSMLLSSCVIWRYRSTAEFQAECPGGDPALQHLIVQRLDDALAWLESLGAPIVERETGNPRTLGWRFDPRGLTEALVRVAGDVRIQTRFPSAQPLVLATGGFGARLAVERGLALRANPWSAGDGIDYACSLGAALTPGADEFYGRAMPAPPASVSEADFVRAAQLYGRFAHVVDDAGASLLDGEPSWSETDLVQAIARLADGIAWYVVDADAMERTVRERTVAGMIAMAEALGGEVRRAERLDALGLGALRSPKLGRPPFAAVRVQAAVTHTLSGVRVDERARVLDEAGMPIPGLCAAGVDAGGISTGGYSSGLATALVLALLAAETAAT